MKTKALNKGLLSEAWSGISTWIYVLAILAVSASIIIPSYIIYSDWDTVIVALDETTTGYISWDELLEMSNPEIIGNELSTILFLLPVWGVAVMSFVPVSGLKFMFSQKDADYYGSMPFKRKDIFRAFNGVSAVCTLLIQLACALITTGFSAVMIYHRIDIADFWKNVLLVMTWTLAFRALVAFAYTVSGNILCAVVAFFAFGVSPVAVRSILYLSFDDIGNGLDYVAGGFLSPLFIFPLTEDLTGTDTYGVYILKVLYYLAVALIFTVAAEFAFSKRGAESSGKGYISVGVHRAVSVLLTLPFVSYLTALFIIVKDYNDYYYRMENYTAALVVFAAMAVVFFIFWIVTTGKFRTFFKALPLLLITVAFGGLFYGMYSAGAVLIDNIGRNPERIEWVSLYEAGSKQNYQLTYDEACLVRITNREFIEKTADGILMFEYVTNRKYADGIESVTEEHVSSWENGETVYMQICLKGGLKIIRQVRYYYNEDGFNRFLDKYAPEAVDKILTLPDYDEIRFASKMFRSGDTYSYSSISGSQYEILTSEFNGLSREEKIQMLSDYWSYSDIVLEIDTGYGSLNLNISYNMPQTYKFAKETVYGLKTETKYEK